MDRVEACEQPLHPVIAARTGAPAFDAKSVTLAHSMKIGEMRDAPRAHWFGILRHKLAQRWV